MAEDLRPAVAVEVTTLIRLIPGLETVDQKHSLRMQEGKSLREGDSSARPLLREHRSDENDAEQLGTWPPTGPQKSTAACRFEAIETFPRFSTRISALAGVCGDCPS